MKELKDLLREQIFFESLSENMLDFIAGCGQNQHFKPGEYLGREGSLANFFYIIRSGKVAVQLHHPKRGALTIWTLTPGEYGGFSWIIPPYRMQFDLKAVEHTSVVALDGKCLRAKCQEDYQLGYLLMQQSAMIMEKRLQETRIQLLDVYSSPI
ncbi:MAG: cyclic nucleotide-binding domain-containing protein [Cyclobacteriaceae bacterium]